MNIHSFAPNKRYAIIFHQIKKHHFFDVGIYRHTVKRPQLADKKQVLLFWPPTKKRRNPNVL